MESAPEVEKSDGELSEGELSSEDGEISDEGELPESEPEVEVPPKKSPESVKSHDSGDRFDRYKIWQEAMVNNMRSVISKVGDNGMSESSEETTDSEDENSAFMMVNIFGLGRSNSHHSTLIHSPYLFAILLLCSEYNIHLAMLSCKGRGEPALCTPRDYLIAVTGALACTGGIMRSRRERERLPHRTAYLV